MQSIQLDMHSVGYKYIDILFALIKLGLRSLGVKGRKKRRREVRKRESFKLVNRERSRERKRKRET